MRKLFTHWIALAAIALASVKPQLIVAQVERPHRRRKFGRITNCSPSLGISRSAEAGK
jgi:hypothetical protein